MRLSRFGPRAAAAMLSLAGRSTPPHPDRVIGSPHCPPAAATKILHIHLLQGLSPPCPPDHRRGGAASAVVDHSATSRSGSTAAAGSSRTAKNCQGCTCPPRSGSRRHRSRPPDVMPFAVGLRPETSECVMRSPGSSSRRRAGRGCSATEPPPGRLRPRPQSAQRAASRRCPRRCLSSGRWVSHRRLSPKGHLTCEP